MEPAGVAGWQQHQEEPRHHQVHTDKLPGEEEVNASSHEVHHTVDRDTQDRPERDEERVGVGNAKVEGEVEDDREG